MTGTILRTLLLAALVFALASRGALGDEGPTAANEGATAKAVPEEPSRLSYDLAVASGGGYDSNLSRASGPAAVTGATFGTGRAAAGAALLLSEDDELSLETAWEGTLFGGRQADLSEHSPSLSFGWLHAFGPRWMLRLSALGDLRLTTDPARAGWDAAATASLRVRLLERLALRLSGTAHRRDARDDAYGGDGLRARAALEVDLWARSWLTLAYAADFGQDTFYRPTTTTPTATAAYGPGAGQGSGGGSPSGAFGTPLVAYRDDRVAHLLSADLTQPLPGGFFLQAGYAFTAVRGRLQSYDAHAVTAEVGWRR